MRTIYECYQDINEDFNCDLVRMFKQDMYNSKISNDNRFHELISTLGIDDIQWNKVEDSDIDTWTNIDDVALRFFRAIRANKSDFIGEKGKRIPIKDQRIVIFVYDNDIFRGVFSARRDAIYTNTGEGRIDSPSAMVDFMKHSDCWYIVNISKRDTRKLVNDRLSARRDMVPDLDAEDRKMKHNANLGILGKSAGGSHSRWEGGAFNSYCVSQIEQAQKRYKQIIAQNQYKKTADSTKIEEMVKKCLDGYTEVMKVAMSDPDKYRYSLSTITEFIQGKPKGQASGGGKAYGYITGGLLNSYKSYCEAMMSLAKNDSYSSMYIDQKSGAEKSIESIYNQMKSYAKKEFDVDIK